MIAFMEETEKFLDSQLWHACAGSMVQMPSLNSCVFYFPQGHYEHASGNFDFRDCPKIPSYVPCRVSAINFLADHETDEVFVKMRLVPIQGGGDIDGDEDVGMSGSDKPTSFAKTLTQSDANNGGGFSVPRYCAETIFPPLDYSADPPVQMILAKDVHGEVWKFRHIYRGTPRRHLLTTGWSTFVNHKKLVAGDSIVFMRVENNDLCVGIRRAKRGIEGAPTGWNGNSLVPFGGFYSKLGEGDRNGNWIGKGRVKSEDVIEAAALAASGRAFDVVYYPRASTPEFCVKAGQVKAAMQVRWCSGMRFKMAFETEDSSRISWFMGTISSVRVADPIQWPDSPWRLLQVSWDEPDLLQNVKRVNPWLVELVSNVPAIHLSPFSPPQKKLRLPQNSEFPLDHQITLPAFSGNPFGYFPPAGMQGARHAQYGLSLPSKLQPSLFPLGFLDRIPAPGPAISKPDRSDNISCLLSMGNSFKESKKPAPFTLFGQPILTEKQISVSCSSDKTGNTSDGSGSAHNQNEGVVLSSCEEEVNLEIGQCKVFMESEDVGRVLDLSLLDSYEQLYGKLADLFEIQVSEIQNRVVQYRDSSGAVGEVGDQSFSDFTKMARRLTIVGDSSVDNDNK